MADIILKNKQGESVIYEGITTISFDTPDENVQAVFSEGVTAEKTIPSSDLNLADGSMEVTPSEGTLLTKVIIMKPDDLIPAYIKRGIVIAGVTGEMDGAENAPQLHQVSISRSSNVVTITNPSTNGDYVEGYKVYNGDKFIMAITDKTFNVETLDDGDGEYSIVVSAIAEGFVESEVSAAVTATMKSILFEMENMHIETESVVLSGLTYATVLVPDDGYYLPEYIEVTVDGVAVDYTYDSYTGELSIPNVTANVTVSASAYDYPKLRTPVIVSSGQSIAVIPPTYADYTYVYVNDELIETIVSPARWWVEEVDGAEYGFALNSGGYYQSENKGVANSYALCKLMIHAAEESTITIKCINYAESSNDYGILSELDTELNLSAVGDTDGVAKSFKGSSSTSVQSVSYIVPQGTHFIYAKFIKDSSTNSYNDTLQVTVSV